MSRCSSTSLFTIPTKASNIYNLLVVVVAHTYPTVPEQRQTLTIGQSALLLLQLDYFVVGGMRTCLGVSRNPIFLRNSSNYCSLNLLLVRSHHAEISIVKRLIQGRNNVTKVPVELRPCHQSHHKNDAFTHSALLI